MAATSEPMRLSEEQITDLLKEIEMMLRAGTWYTFSTERAIIEAESSSPHFQHHVAGLLTYIAIRRVS